MSLEPLSQIDQHWVDKLGFFDLMLWNRSVFLAKLGEFRVAFGLNELMEIIGMLEVSNVEDRASNFDDLLARLKCLMLVTGRLEI